MYFLKCVSVPLSARLLQQDMSIVLDTEDAGLKVYAASPVAIVAVVAVERVGILLSEKVWLSQRDELQPLADTIDDCA